VSAGWRQLQGGSSSLRPAASWSFSARHKAENETLSLNVFKFAMAAALIAISLYPSGGA